MRKYLLILFFFVVSIKAWAQKVTRIELLQSESFIGLKRNGENTNKVIKPIFRQDNATLTCDSAYFYLERNGFEAFGNVHINQADTINIYSDHLNYDGNTKLAILKNNVRLTDREAVLTTNDLDYNLGTKIGRYYNGGKIVNGKNTLTSQNGYYFTENKDAYFRHRVVVTSPEVLIKSDTLKYNTFSKIAYFFGPTNIYGKTDTLYTENGQYNTTNDQASFGKNNLYTQNSKSLKGDSLFYDGKAGYGRAVKNIIFIDTAQKVELRGDLGVYHKTDESVVVTKNAYVVFTTEKDSVTKDSIYMAADTLKSQVLRKMDLYQLQQKSIQSAIDTAQKKNATDSLTNPVLITDALLTVHDSLASPDLQITQKDSSAADSTIKKVPKEQPKEKEVLKPKDKNARIQPVPVEIVSTAPTTAVNLAVIKQKKNNEIGIEELPLPTKISKKAIEIDIPPEASDTAKTRIIRAYKNVKIFKSDLQAKADSAFFSYSDSTIRMYQHPIVWAQGSQMSADTMYIQLKNKKVDNLDLIRNAIVVNTEKDSTKFNQVAGKTMKGFFKNSKLDVVFVNGNAESIYFPKDSSGDGGMMRSIASRMRINFQHDSLMQIASIRQPEHNYYPKEKITEELRTLANFNWKPKERPRSKEEIIPNLRKAKTAPAGKSKKPVAEKKPEPAINDKVKQAKPALVPKPVE